MMSRIGTEKGLSENLTATIGRNQAQQYGQVRSVKKLDAEPSDLKQKVMQLAKEVERLNHLQRCFGEIKTNLSEM